MPTFEASTCVDPRPSGLSGRVRGLRRQVLTLDELREVLLSRINRQRVRLSIERGPPTIASLFSYACTTLALTP